jgi:hypothetical protein
MATPKGYINFDIDGIGHVLADRVLAVPVYQRSYAWGVEQVEDFWEDLRDALAAGVPEYFLGTIVLTGPHDGRYVVIDGQQRLVTAALLFSAIRDAYLAREDHRRGDHVQHTYLAAFDLSSGLTVPRLMLNAEDREFFESVVIQGTARPPTTGSHRRIEAAYRYLRSRVEEDLAAHEPWEDRTVRWLEFVAQSVRVIVVAVPSEADAFLIFETLNDRGAPLTISDLLRNYLMAQSGERVDEVTENWVAALGNLDLADETNLFLDFLRQYWSSVNGAVRERDLYTSIRKTVEGEDRAVAFAHALPDASALYAALLDAGHERWDRYPEDVRASINTLLTLDLGQFRPLALAVMEHFVPDEQARTMRALVSWSVRGLLVGGIGGGVTESAYCSAAVRVRAADLSTADELLSRLRPIVPSDDDFRLAFQRARVARPAIARYLLLALQQAAEGRDSPELVTDAALEAVRLDYVMPRKVEPTEWRGFAADEVGVYVTRLGNRVLFSAAEEGFGDGATFAQRRGALIGATLSLTSQVAEFESWNPETIDARQADMARRAISVWPREPAALVR